MRAVWFALPLAGCGLFGPTPPASLEGDRLVDARGMSLYTQDRDRAYSGQSLCDPSCARDWPPFVAAPDARRNRKFGLLKRDDGQRQWTHDGKPLYYHAGDRNPGDTAGHGVANLWRLAR